ncbi:MAG: hypothetical protein JXN63_06295 [Candidatus Delongbacteria bacterium]|nr:hypothetical protein [Candidatus Delongbacteria bacterium]
MKKVMFYIILSAVFAVYAEKIVTISGEASYTHGDLENKVQAEQTAITHAKRDAVEKYATMIKSSTVIENFELKKDRIAACSVGLLKNTVYLVKEYSYPTWEIKLTAELDEDEMMKMLKEASETSELTGKINDLVESGMSAEKSYRIGDALKNYYWAYLLVNCDEYNRQMKLDSFDKRLLTVALPERINKIFSDIKIEVADIRSKPAEKNVILKISYNDFPVTNFDFTYYTGDTWSSVKARNGLAQVDLFGHSAESVSRLMIRAEYKFENLIKFENDIVKALENLQHYPFPNASWPPIDITKAPEPVAATAQPKESKKITIEKDVCLESVVQVVEVIKSKKYHEVKHLFTDAGYIAFQDLIMYGNASILLDETELKSYKLNDQTVVRSVPMSFTFPRSDAKFTENVVFTFDTDDKIDALTFSLSEIAVRDIMNRPDSFGTTEEKIQLVQFMELYKTAYCLKQADYIESIFADNALIIVGRVLKPGEQIDGMYDELAKGKRVKYDKMGKKEYMHRLRGAFNSNEFININFEDNTVEKKNRQKVYALEIKQYYNSTNYSDEGYLFLLMDLRNIKEPKIYVRAWQPDSMRTEDRIKLADFKISF